jgi:HD superfamily phosphodiesterase
MSSCFPKTEHLKEDLANLFQKDRNKAYWEHTLRVCDYARQIATKEEADIELCIAAALIHDIGRLFDPSFEGHIEQTRLQAPALLKEAGFAEDETSKIVQIAISHHPATGQMLEALEAKVLFDADNLDCVGGLGTLRWFENAWENSQHARESAELFIQIAETCIKARGSLFMTATGREFGNKGFDFTLKLCHMISKETEAL